MLFLGTTIDGLQLGLCYAVLALGLYLSYSILDFPDLSVDGTFPLGGVVCTVLMYRLGIPSGAAVILTFFVGMLAGAVTGVLHVRFRISKLLAGIIVMTSLLSINLALTKFLTDNGYTTTIFSYRSKGLRGLFGSRLVTFAGKRYEDLMTILLLLAIVIAVKLILDLFLKTKLGYMLRATGDNEKLVVSLSRDPGRYKILGLSLANGLVAVSGALYSHLYASYDNNCGSGKVVLALASVIIGLAVFSNFRIFKDTSAVIFGAILYSLCLNYLVLVDKNGIYLKLLNAVMFALILVFNDRIMGLRSRLGRRVTTEEEDTGDA